MDCKRCGKELPVGQRTSCPHCGIYLHTHITPRGVPGKTKRKNNRALVMSFLSVGLVVAVVCVFIPFMRSSTKNNMLEKIDAMFLEMNGNESEFTEDEWKRKLAVFSGAVANLEKSFPKDAENIGMANTYLALLCGIDPDTGDILDPYKAQRDHLIRTGREDYIDILNIAFTKQDGRSSFTVEIKNNSSITINRVTMEFEAFKPNGNPSNGSRNGDNKWGVNFTTPIRPGEVESLSFSDIRHPWTDEEIASVKLLWLNVVYGPNNEAYFAPEVCAALWR
jgi:ribosomal protein L37E